MSTNDNDNEVFRLKGTVEFANRSNMIFQCLNELEEKHDKWKAETPVLLDLQKPEPSTSEVLDSKTVAFKRPRLPLSLKRKRKYCLVPDYVMNPHKWKKYSLADAPAITEESNTAVAMQFMKDLRKNRDEMEVADDLESITYRKPAAADFADQPQEQVQEEASASSSSSFLCSSVHKMPELVVGEKRHKVAKSVTPNAKVDTVVKLDHLEETGEEM